MEDHPDVVLRDSFELDPLYEGIRAPKFYDFNNPPEDDTTSLDKYFSGHQSDASDSDDDMWALTSRPVYRPAYTELVSSIQASMSGGHLGSVAGRQAGRQAGWHADKCCPIL
eukprot:jgi/Mesen1/4271/ME000022S03562